METKLLSIKPSHLCCSWSEIAAILSSKDVRTPNSSLLIPGAPGIESEGISLDEKGHAAIGSTP